MLFKKGLRNTLALIWSIWPLPTAGRRCTHGKCYYWGPEECFSWQWCFLSASMRLLLPTLSGCIILLNICFPYRMELSQSVWNKIATIWPGRHNKRKKTFLVSVCLKVLLCEEKNTINMTIFVSFHFLLSSLPIVTQILKKQQESRLGKSFSRYLCLV